MTKEKKVIKYSGGGFRITINLLYNPKHPITEVIRQLNIALEKVTSFYSAYGNNFNLNFPIDLLYQRSEYDEYLDYKTEKWASGCCCKGRVALFHPDFFEIETSHKKEDFPKTLAHEISHMFDKMLFGENYLWWVHEGIAQYVANQDVVKKIKPENVEHFIVNSLYFNKNYRYFAQQLGHQISKRLAFAIVDHYGEGTLFELIKIKPDKNTKQKIAAILKVPQNEIEKTIRAFLVEQKIIINILPTFDIDIIKQVLQNDFPSIAIKNINLIANGWDNMVAEINNEYIFRFPKDVDCTFYQEIKILDYLQEKISILIPTIEFLGKSYTYMGYKKIPGNDLTKEVYELLSPDEKEKLTFDLANFLKEFHSSISVAQAKEIGLEVEDYDSYLYLINKRINNRFDDVQISSFTESTCLEFAAMASKQQNIVVLYNDLHTENIAFNNINKRVVGIFDFGDVMIGDIHFDFHQLYKFDPILMSAVALKYQELTGVNLELRRMVILARINELCDLAEFIDKPESRVYKNALVCIKMWIEDINIFKNQ